MALVCEDLAKYGVVLVAPSTPEYFELLADLEHRLQNRPAGGPPIPESAISRIAEHDTSGSAILVNRANVAIASLTYVWEGAMTCLPGTDPSVLLPFGWDSRSKKAESYWSLIFPGSKRLMTCDGSEFGDNTDVRPPAADELGPGWGVGAGRGRGGRRPTKLRLDGVFFVDGGFAGANELGSWEQTVLAAEAYLACAALAREVRRKGAAAQEFFDRLQELTGPIDEGRFPFPPRFGGSEAADAEAIRKFARQMAGRQVLALRKSVGDEATVARVDAWADARVPQFHKL